MDGEESLMVWYGNGDIVGFQFEAATYCRSCIVSVMRAAKISVGVGNVLDVVAKAAEKLGIDMEEENTYDSGDFPKVVLGQSCLTELIDLPDEISDRGTLQLSDEQCDGCHKWLMLDEKSPRPITLAKQLAEDHDVPLPLARAAVDQLREWGFTHKDFIETELFMYAVHLVPHAFEMVKFNIYKVPVSYFTPQQEGDECVHCNKEWEWHTFVCDVCKEVVKSTDVHRHVLPVKGQRPLFRIPVERVAA